MATSTLGRMGKDTLAELDRFVGAGKAIIDSARGLAVVLRALEEAAKKRKSVSPLTKYERALLNAVDRLDRLMPQRGPGLVKTKPRGRKAPGLTRRVR